MCNPAGLGGTAPLASLTSEAAETQAGAPRGELRRLGVAPCLSVGSPVTAFSPVDTRNPRCVSSEKTKHNLAFQASLPSQVPERGHPDTRRAGKHHRAREMCWGGEPTGPPWEGGGCSRALCHPTFQPLCDLGDLSHPACSPTLPGPVSPHLHLPKRSPHLWAPGHHTRWVQSTLQSRRWPVAYAGLGVWLSALRVVGVWGCCDLFRKLQMTSYEGRRPHSKGARAGRLCVWSLSSPWLEAALMVTRPLLRLSKEWTHDERGDSADEPGSGDAVPGGHAFTWTWMEVPRHRERASP